MGYVDPPPKTLHLSHTRPVFEKTGRNPQMIGAEFGHLQKTNQAVKTLTSVGKYLRCLERHHICVLGAQMVQLNTFLDTMHRPKREF